MTKYELRSIRSHFSPTLAQEKLEESLQLQVILDYSS